MDKKVTTCRSCGAPIVWIKTRAGKAMPCDAEPIYYRATSEAKGRARSCRVVTAAGDVVNCVPLTDPVKSTGVGYVPHWSTCDAPHTFRKKGEEQHGTDEESQQLDIFSKL